MLSLGIKRGSKIMVDDTLVRVDRIDGPNSVWIAVVKGDEKATFLLTDAALTEIMPGVRVQCGGVSERCDDHYTRLAFEADREIQIDRVRRAPKDEA